VVCFTPNTRNDGPIDGGPQSDVVRAYPIGMGNEPAFQAPELSLGATVSLSGMVAHGTLARSIARVNGLHLNAAECCLVGKKGTQLKESPSRMFSALAFSDRYPIADAFEILNGNASAGVFGLCDNSFRDDVIHVRSEAGFAPGKTLEVSLGTLGTGGLEAVTEPLHTLAHSFNTRSAMLFSVGIHGEVADAKVYTEPSLWVDGSAVWNIDRHIQEPPTLAEYQVGLATNALQAGTVVGSRDVRHEDASSEREQRYAVHSFEGHDALVIRDGTVGFETGPFAPVALVDFADLGDGPHGHLRRDSEAVSQLVVVEALERQFVCGPTLEGALRQPVASRVDAFHGGEQRLRLFVRGKQLGCRHEFHD